MGSSESNPREKTPVEIMLDLLKEVEKCRVDVDGKQAELEEAKIRLENAEEKVADQLSNLDITTRERFSKIFEERTSGNIQKSDDNEAR